MPKPVCWAFSSEKRYRSKSDIWFERQFVIRLNCEACSGTIPTTHPEIELSAEVLEQLKGNYDRHVNTLEFRELLSLLPPSLVRLYSGAAIGCEKVIKFHGRPECEVLWAEMTPILKEVDIERLQNEFEGRLVTRDVENLDSDDRLLEVIRRPIDLERLYPKISCDLCEQPDTDYIKRTEIERIAESAALGNAFYEIPGGRFLAGEKFKSAIERLGLKNAAFTRFHLGEYLSEFPKGI